MADTTEYANTTLYPAFGTGDDETAATAKQDMLKALAAEMEPNCPNWKEILYRINNTDMLTGVAVAGGMDTDGGYQYDPADLFGSKNADL